MNKKYISLKEAAKISGYAPDYIGWLIRKRRIKGRKIFSGVSLQTTKEAVLVYKNRTKKPLLRKVKKVGQIGHQKYISLKEAAKISGYAPDYLGWLIRKGKIKGKKVYTGISWQTTEEAIKSYQRGKTKSQEKILFNFPSYLKSIHLIPQGGNKVFGFGWRLTLTAVIIFFFISGFAPIRFFQASIAALTGGETKIVNFYTTVSTGDWQNPQNVQGPPEAGPLADLNSFSEANSAIYKTGPKNIVCDNFQVTNVEEKIFQSAKIKFSFAIGEKEPDILQIEQPTTSSEPEINSTSSEESTSFWDKIKDFFSALGVRIAEIAKALVIKVVSVAKAEEETSPTTSSTPTENTENESLQTEATTTEETTIEATISPEMAITTEATTTETTTTEPTIEEATSTEIEATTTEATTTATTTDIATTEEEAITTEGATTTEEVTEATTTEETLPNLDTKIIIWWSLDGQNWQVLDTTSDYPLSNALNGGYFSYDASFLKNWEDIKNLKIKFEGVVGGQTNVEAFLDSVWVEVTYQQQITEEESPEEEFVEEEEIEEEPEEEEIEDEEIIEEGEIGQIELLFGKDDFRSDEEPEFKFQYKKIKGTFSNWKNINIKAQIKNSKGEIIDISPDFDFENNGEFLVKIKKPREFKPGLYKVILSIEDEGSIQEFEQDFTWGVLAINTNKSIYISNLEQGISDEAYIQMAALRDDGHTICDAQLELQITNPSHQTAILSTEDGKIQYSGKCGPDNVTDTPDYFAYYRVGEIGIYQMKLTNLDNGYEISDSFEVRESVPFDVERIGPTRIYPPATYEMTLRIKANQDFEGQVVEQVPNSFETLNPKSEILNKFQIQNSNDPNTKQIVWQVDWRAGEEYELRYQFDAPDISPYIYLLGPLEIGDFKEIRQWQIASDQLENMILLWDKDEAPPTGWTCISCSADDDFYQVFPRGAETYGATTSGAATHTHTVSYFDCTANAGLFFDFKAGGPTLHSHETHKHTGIDSQTVGAASNNPLYRNLKFIRYSGVTTTIPNGAIAIFDTPSVPGDWDLYTNQDTYFLRGENSTTTGGSNTHTHSVSVTSTAPDTTEDGTEDLANYDLGTHKHTGSNTSNEVDHRPPYLEVVFAKANTTTTMSYSGLIAMFDDTPGANWEVVSTSTGDFYQKFIVASSTAYGGTGGQATNTHANLGITLGATPNTGSTADDNPLQCGASYGHTHTMTVQFTTENNLPVYRDVIFAQYTAPPALTLNQRSVVWQNDDGDASGDPTTGGYVNQNTTSTNPDTSLTMEKGERATWRVQIDNTGDAAATSKVYELEWAATSSPGGCASSLTWADVTASSEIAWSLGLSGTSSEILTTSTCATSSKTWTDGEWREAAATTSSHTLTNNYYTEFGFMIHTGNAQASTTYCLRLYNNTDNQPLDSYNSFGELFIDASSTKRYSKDAASSPLPSTTTDFTYYLDHEGYDAVGTDEDGKRDPITSSSNIPVFLFAKKHTNNTDGIVINWDGQSTAAPSSATATMEIWNGSSWENVDSDNSTGAATDFTLSGNKVGTNYYDASFWVYVRVYQASGSQTLKTDYISISFVTPITISGKVYSDEGNNELSTEPIVSLAINGSFETSTTASSTNGSFSFSVVPPGTGTSTVVYLDDPDEKGVSHNRYSGSGDITDFHIYQNRVSVRHDDSGPITNTDLGKYDGSNDDDIKFTVLGGAFTASSTHMLYIWLGSEFRPGGSVTTEVGATSSQPGGDIKIASSTSIFNVETNAVSCGGDWTNLGTFSKSLNQTTTLTAISTGFSIDPGSSNFENLTFNDSGGGWEFTTSTTIDSDFTITNGTVTAPSGTLTISGNYNNSGGTFTHNLGTVLFNAGDSDNTIAGILTGSSAFYNLTFNNSDGVWDFQNNASTTNDLTITAGTLDLNGQDLEVDGNLSVSGILKADADAGTVVLTGAGNFGGAGTTTVYNLTLSGTTTLAGDIDANNTLSITSGNSLDVSGSSYEITVGGSWSNSGTFTAQSGLVTFDATTTENITVDGSEFYQLEFNGSGQWTFQDAATATATTTLSAGTLVQAADYNLTLASFTLATSTTFTVATGTGKLIFSSANPIYIEDQNTTKQNLGNVHIGASPAVTNQNSDIVVESLTVNAGNTHNTRGYDIDCTTFITVNGPTGTLNAEDTKAGDGSIITLGTNWTVASDAIFTADETENTSTTVIFDEGTSGTVFPGGTDEDHDFHHFQVAKTAVATTTLQGAIHVEGDLTISNSSSTLDVGSNYDIYIGGNWSNSGNFIAQSATTTFDATTTGKTINPGSSAFYNLTFNGSGGGWTFSANATTSNDLNITNGTVTSTSGTLYVGGDWNATTTATFYHSNGEVIFYATSTGHKITDGGSPFYLITFNGTGGGWFYQDSTSTAPATTTMQAGTATFLNAKTGNVSVDEGTLNVDWYLGIHVVDEDETDYDIDTTGTDPIVISEASSSAAIWRHNGNWVGPVSSTSTDSDESGKNPQPNNNLAIRIREYSKTNTTTTFYKYNLEITLQSGYGAYSYYSVRESKYITSTSSLESGEDRCISQDWHRADISALNDYPAVNNPPTKGSWFVGMASTLEFSVSATSTDLGSLDSGNDWTAIGTTTLSVTTTAYNGYVVKAYADYQGRLELDETYYIDRWIRAGATNATPTSWDINCSTSSEYCGFGYTTDDDTLGETNPDRFASSTFCGAEQCWAGFATSSASTDPVADDTGPVEGVQTAITYKVSVDESYVAGTYSTKIYYICTANY